MAVMLSWETGSLITFKKAFDSLKALYRLERSVIIGLYANYVLNTIFALCLIACNFETT